MKRLILLSGLFFVAVQGLISQPYAVGHRQVTPYDSTRNRMVTAEVYYPAASPGNNVPVYAGRRFPVILFGHGFAMGYQSYQNFVDVLVPVGFILVLPTTESGVFPAPDHQAFADDLRFLADYMRQESQQPLSPFYNSLSGKTALAGHSMGGGCAVLAASSAYDIDALVTFAAAETNPSAIAAAAGVTAPALFFIGERDCVTPYGQHQEGMFSRLASGCKYLLSIKDGMHCYFANYNFNCTFGESTCQPTPSINRNDQHAVVFRYLIPFLQSTLKGNCEAWDAMRDSMAYDSQLAMTLDTCSHVCLGCDEPTGLTVKRITPYSARLCWDTTAHATGYRIRGKPLQGGVLKYLLVAGGSTPCRDIYGLTNQTVYVWQVQAVCDTAFSGWSMADTFTAVCRPPDSLFAGPIAATAARLNWLPVTGAYAYEIKGKRLGSPVWVSLVTTGNSKTVYGLIPSTTYLWKVRTLCHATGAIASVFSAVDTFTTQALRVMNPTGFSGLSGNDRAGGSGVEGIGCFPSGEPAASGQLFDLMGKAVSPRIDPCDRSALRRHLEALPPGVYLLRYRGGVKKVIHGG